MQFPVDRIRGQTMDHCVREDRMSMRSCRGRIAPVGNIHRGTIPQR